MGSVTTGLTTCVTPHDPLTAERLAAIEERLAVLREQADAMAQRASIATKQARDIQERTPVASAHSQQVAVMQAAIDAASHELEGLRTAMQTRAIIEQAKGMLMLHAQCDADAAFQQLVELSQTSHRKLVEVAQVLVTSWTSHGPA